MRQLPPITKNLLIINALVYLATLVCAKYGIMLEAQLGLFFVGSPFFSVWQPFTYMFVHGGFWHLFFNMFSLWMFGRIMEVAWGPKRFLIFYLVCGIGAGISQEVFQTIQWLVAQNNLDQDLYNMVMVSPTVGASGAIYGILLAFGMTYPNERIMLLIPPIPMKAKYFVGLFAVIELYSALSDNGGNIAHCAHLGGMLFGLLLILYWRHKNGGGGKFNGWNSWKPKKKSHWEEFRLKMKAVFSRKCVKAETENGNFAGRKSDYEYNAERHRNEERLNQILDKIKRSGYESLTGEEKQELFKSSSKK